MLVSSNGFGRMSTFICWVALLGGAKGVLAAQLILYDFTGAAGNEDSFGPAFQPGNGNVSDIGRGSGLGASTATSAFSARSWSTDALDLDDYFGFSISPNEGFEMNLMTLEFDERRSGSGISSWSVRTSLDGFTLDLSPGHVVVPDNTETRLGQSVELASEIFSSLDNEVEFRIYGFGAEGSSGTWRIDNVQLFGEITPVPEPSSLISGALMGLFAAYVGIHRRFFWRAAL